MSEKEEEITHEEDERMETSSDSELDEEDLNLIQENTGQSNFRRLRQIDQPDDLENVFSDSENEDEDQRERGVEKEVYDELDDFIVNDEDQPIIKKPRVQSKMADDLGFSQEIFQEAMELFGDGSDYAYALKPREQEQEEKKLKNIYEPIELEERYFTEKDDLVRARDAPERFQEIGYVSVETVEELDDEIQWITRRLHKDMELGRREKEKSQVQIVVRRVLIFLRKDLFEVPFIIRHRSDYYCDVLEDEDIYRIFDYSIEFSKFNKKKQKFSEYPEVERIVFEDQLLDLAELVSVRHPQKIKSELKRPVKSDLYQLCIESGIDKLTEQFCISSEQLGHNLKSGLHEHKSEDPKMTPEELAQAYTSAQFSSSFQVLNAARFYMAKSISTDLDFRAWLKRRVVATSALSTKPTVKGRSLIAYDSEYYKVKYLASKPLSDLRKDCQFLLIEKGVSEGVLEYTLEINSSDIRKQVEEKFLSDGYSIQSEKWNQERVKVVDLIFKDLKWVEKWLLDQLRSYDEDRILSDYEARLVKRLKAKPNKQPLICIAMDESGIFAAKLSETGEVDDYKRIFNLDELDKLDEWEASAVVTSGYSLVASKLLEKIKVFAASKQMPYFVVDDLFSRVYMNSEVARKQFADFPPLLRYAISFGRTSQDALVEYASMYEELHIVNLHPLQYQVNQDKLRMRMERAFIRVVCETGSEITGRGSCLLRFVSGLGLRKSALIKDIDTRSDLITQIGFGKVVFVNCASFLKIDGSEILDTTRIHPEDYKYAKKIAQDALEEEDVDVEEVIGSESLNDLMLDSFATEIRNKSGEMKRVQLERIRDELKKPYYETRIEINMPSIDDVFEMFSGGQLKRGMVVACLVKRVRDKSLHLDCMGLDGFITSKNMDPSRQIKEGQSIKCKIIEVYKDRFSIELSLRDVVEVTERPEVDKYFDVKAEALDKETTVQTDQRAFRSIKHPLFKNMNSKEAENFLRDKQQGDLVFRPSSQSSSIVLTWKLADGEYQHIEIKEDHKENDMMLGRTLQIGNETFGDLDEIHAMFVEPMSRLVRELMNHPKFVRGSEAELTKHVERELLLNHKRIPYVIGLDRKFLFVFKLSMNKPTQVEPFDVVSDGFKYRGMKYSDVHKLINAFKTSVSQQTSGSAGGRPQQQQQPVPPPQQAPYGQYQPPPQQQYGYDRRPPMHPQQQYMAPPPQQYAYYQQQQPPQTMPPNHHQRPPRPPAPQGYYRR